MSEGLEKRTAAQEILLAADDLTATGHSEFSEWDLSVAAWRRDKNRFGCRGYEDLYPDHKRVMMEVMGQTKRDNPIRRGFIEKIRANYYRVTALGQSEASRIRSRGSDDANTVRSAGRVFTAIESYVIHRSFVAWRRDPEEPRSWLGAAAFLGLTKADANDLNDRLRAVRTALAQAAEWFQETGSDALTRGPSGGSKTFAKNDVLALEAFVDVLEARFQRQIDAIRRRES